MGKQYKSMTEELIEKASKQKPKEEKKMENVQYILMDEEAMLNSGEDYDLELMYKAFDKVFTEAGYKKNENVTEGVEYYGCDDLPKTFGVNSSLKKQNWFLPYCKKWIWTCINPDGEIEVFDKLERLRERDKLWKKNIGQ